MKNVLLALSFLDGNGVFPSFKSADYSIDNKPAEVLELPSCLINLKCEYAGQKMDRTVVERCLQEDDLAKTLRIAISYCWAATKAFSEEERLKLLWGSFNALYREYGRLNEMNCRIDTVMLDEINDLFLQGSVLCKSLQVFMDEIGSAYKSFVRWKVITGSRSQSLYLHSKTNKKSEGAIIKRLHKLDLETLTCMRDFGCGDVGGKKLLKGAIANVIQDVSERDSPLRKTCLLLCRYIYIFRCDGVHANVEYPVFDSQSRQDKRILADLLEAAIADFSSWLSRTQR